MCQVALVRLLRVSGDKTTGKSVLVVFCSESAVSGISDACCVHINKNLTYCTIGVAVLILIQPEFVSER